MTDTPMTQDRLAEIRNRNLDEVTPGPWLVADGSNGRPVVYVETLRDGRLGARVLLAADGATEADVQFIASARSSVPELLAELNRLRSRPAVYQTVLVPDSGSSRTGRTYSTLAAAQADCEAEQRTAPLPEGTRFDWFLYPGPGPRRRWQLHLYLPGDDIPEISDYMVREIPVLDAVPAGTDEAADLAEGRAQLDAMRADHPAPCRVPDSPDCTCPPTEAQLRRIEQDRPETGIAHEGCTLPLGRLLACGHCQHQVCEDCDRCPHTCRCAQGT